jgi:hypothetical protein
VKPFRIPRRALLRGAGGVAIGLPFLEIMTKPGRAAAQSAAGPKRFLTFFSSAGTIHENWVPTGTETNFQFSRILAPLEPLKSKVIVVDGLRNYLGTPPPGDDHQRGIGTMSTQVSLQTGNTPPTCNQQGFQSCGLAGGISLDQYVANSIGAATRFKSLELGVQTGGAGDVMSYTSYCGPGMADPSEDDPAAVFNRIFTNLTTGGGSGMPDPAALQRAAQRKSVLDAVIDSYGSLSPKLGRIDKATMDSHMSAIRDLEKRLTVVPPSAGVGSSCMKPAAPTIDFMANDNFPAVGKLQMDLLAMAFACDLTRVATLQWELAQGDTIFTWLGANRGHHTISHDDDSNAASVEILTQINLWYGQQFAYLLGKLDAIQEGSGTVLDNTMAFWGNELARGNAHSHWPMPFVLAGGAGGAMKTGRFLTYPQDAGSTYKGSQSNLLVSMMNAVGVAGTTFGDPNYCTGPLAGL